MERFALQRLQRLRQRRELEQSCDRIPKESSAFVHMHHSMLCFKHVISVRFELLRHGERHGHVRMHRLPGKRNLCGRKWLYLYLQQRILFKRLHMPTVQLHQQQLQQRHGLEHSCDRISEVGHALVFRLQHMQRINNIPVRIGILRHGERHGHVRMHRLPGKRCLCGRKRLYLYLRQRIL
jgi:hypothetical protein